MDREAHARVAASAALVEACNLPDFERRGLLQSVLTRGPYDNLILAALREYRCYAHHPGAPLHRCEKGGYVRLGWCRRSDAVRV